MTLRELIDFNAIPDTETAIALTRRYPYFPFPAVKLLCSDSAPADEAAHLLKEAVAINVGDEETLFRLFGSQGEIFSSFYPDSARPALSTGETIDAFIARFGNPSNHNSENIPIEAAIDATMLIETPDDPAAEPVAEDSTSLAINTFLSSTQTSQSGSSTKERPRCESSGLTESFAHILIRNGNYTKALEIIQALSMANPNKSIYFADQIRFLRKLIINQQSH